MEAVNKNKKTEGNKMETVKLSEKQMQIKIETLEEAIAYLVVAVNAAAEKDYWVQTLETSSDLNWVLRKAEGTKTIKYHNI